MINLKLSPKRIVIVVLAIAVIALVVFFFFRSKQVPLAVSAPSSRQDLSAVVVDGQHDAPLECTPKLESFRIGFVEPDWLS
jgi:hypothetical protein